MFGFPYFQDLFIEVNQQTCSLFWSGKSSNSPVLMLTDKDHSQARPPSQTTQNALQTSANHVLQSGLRTSALLSPTLFAESTAVCFKAAITRSREASAKLDWPQKNLTHSVSHFTFDSKQPSSNTGRIFFPINPTQTQTQSLLHPSILTRI